MRKLNLISLLLLTMGAAWAKDGAAIFKSKCAGCHGAQGQGKTGPKLAGTSLSEDDIVNVLTAGCFTGENMVGAQVAPTVECPLT